MALLKSTLTLSGSVGGVTFYSVVQRESEGIIGQSPTLPAAVAGTLTTRTDDNTGTITATATQSTITTGMKVDVYLDGGRQYNITVGTVSGTGNVTIPIDLGTGDNLPAAQTEVTVSPRTTVACLFDGDLLLMLAAYCAAIGRIEFYVGSSMELGVDLPAGEPFPWWSGLSTNPLAGHAVTSVVMSQAGTTAIGMKFGAQIDSVT